MALGNRFVRDVCALTRLEELDLSGSFKFYLEADEDGGEGSPMALGALTGLGSLESLTRLDLGWVSEVPEGILGSLSRLTGLSSLAVPNGALRPASAAPALAALTRLTRLAVEDLDCVAPGWAGAVAECRSVRELRVTGHAWRASADRPAGPSPGDRRAIGPLLRSMPELRALDVNCDGGVPFEALDAVLFGTGNAAIPEGASDPDPPPGAGAAGGAAGAGAAGAGGAGAAGASGAGGAEGSGTPASGASRLERVTLRFRVADGAVPVPADERSALRDHGMRRLAGALGHDMAVGDAPGILEAYVAAYVEGLSVRVVALPAARRHNAEGSDAPFVATPGSLGVEGVGILDPGEGQM